MAGAERRSATRHLADWPARCSFDGQAGWHRCRIIDISTHGAALEVGGDASDDGLRGTMQLEITSVAGDEAAVTMRATVRRHVRAGNGQLVLGIAFQPLTQSARNLLQLMIGLRTRA
jgi:hypothetical protein